MSSEEQKYEFELVRDDRGRLQAEIVKGIRCSIKELDGDDAKRVSGGTHAYVVMQIDTEIGVFIRRNIRIQYSDKSLNFFLRYEQFPTDRQNGSGEKVTEWLDVFGPKGKTTRNRVQELILRLFEETKQRTKAGKLPPKVRRKRSDSSSSKPRQEVHAGAISDRPEVVAQLESVRESLVATSTVVEEVASSVELVAEIEVPAPEPTTSAEEGEFVPFDAKQLLSFGQ